MSVGRTVRLFLSEGSPTGILVAEIINWTGHILVVPRSRLPEALSRPESSSTGIYILSGEDSQFPDRQRIYIGEADNISVRLRSHERKPERDYWTHAYLITSKDSNLTKAHARYLEGRLVEIARRTGRAVVDNVIDPAPKNLPQSDIADMEYFLDQLEILLPVIGVNAFRPAATRGALESNLANGVEEGVALRLVSQNGGADAIGVERDGELTVFAGSFASTQIHNSNSYATLRRSLIEDGAIVELPDGRLQFTRDTVFKSPSAAAAVILNRSSNGLLEWRLRDERTTLKQWQQSRMG